MRAKYVLPTNECLLVIEELTSQGALEGTDCGNSLELSRMLMIQRHQFLRRLANARRFWFSSELAALEVISLDVKCSSQSETEGWSKHSRKKTFTSTAIVPHTHLRKLAAVILLFCNVHADAKHTSHQM